MTTELFQSGSTADVVVVGGGVIGLSIARELKARGVREVTAIERAEFGAEASSAAGGILAPQVEADQADEFFQLASASRDLYPSFAAALRDETGIDVELDRTGTLYVGFNEHNEKELRDRYRWQISHGLNVELLSGDRARGLEPNLSQNVSCALLFPNDFQVENRRLVAALARANEKYGVRLISHCNVTALTLERGRVHELETSRGRIASRFVVVAAGAWASFINGLSPAIDIEPIRGQMLCFRPQNPLARYVIYSARGYLVPRTDGRLLCGSTSERVGFEKKVTSEGENAIRSMAKEILPALSDLSPADSWAGFRPKSADGLPVIGPSDQIDGLLFATGHYRNGILLAPVTAKMIADAIIQGAVPGFASRFSPARFTPVASV